MEVLSDWKVCILNTCTWGYHLKTIAMSIINFSLLSTFIIHVLSPVYNQGTLYESTLFPL